MTNTPIKTAQQLVDEANALARSFYNLMGHEVREDYKFYNATHPQEVLCWNMAIVAYDHIELTDIENALMEIEDEE